MSSICNLLFYTFLLTGHKNAIKRHRKMMKFTLNKKKEKKYILIWVQFRTSLATGADHNYEGSFGRDFQDLLNDLI